MFRETIVGLFLVGSWRDARSGISASFGLRGPLLWSRGVPGASLGSSVKALTPRSSLPSMRCAPGSFCPLLPTFPVFKLSTESAGPRGHTCSSPFVSRVAVTGVLSAVSELAWSAVLNFCCRHPPKPPRASALTEKNALMMAFADDRNPFFASRLQNRRLAWLSSSQKRGVKEEPGLSIMSISGWKGQGRRDTHDAGWVGSGVWRNNVLLRSLLPAAILLPYRFGERLSLSHLHLHGD